MSLQQEGEQIFGEKSNEFRHQQELLLNSSGKHLNKALTAGIVGGGGTSVGSLLVGTGVLVVGGVIGLEMAHQLIASAVDLRKHELNNKRHYISVKNTPIKP